MAGRVRGRRDCPGWIWIHAARERASMACIVTPPPFCSSWRTPVSRAAVCCHVTPCPPAPGSRPLDPLPLEADCRQHNRSTELLLNTRRLPTMPSGSFSCLFSRLTPSPMFVPDCCSAIFCSIPHQRLTCQHSGAAGFRSSSPVAYRHSTASPTQKTPNIKKQHAIICTDEPGIFCRPKSSLSKTFHLRKRDTIHVDRSVHKTPRRPAGRAS